MPCGNATWNKPATPQSDQFNVKWDLRRCETTETIYRISLDHHSRLHTLSCADGETLSRRELPAPPVHEGLIGVESGIFVCLKDGSVMNL